jgi:site-specific recombinase XerD
MSATRALTTTETPPDALDAITALVLDSLTSRHSKDSYRISLRKFRTWFREEWRGPFNRASVQAWKSTLLASGLSPATCNARLAAVKKIATEAAENSLLSNEIASSIARVRGVRRAGVRTGSWLTKEQAQALLSAPDASTFVGLRDRALLAVLIGTGIRREEAVNLTFDHIQLRDSRWVLLDLRGKGNRIRTVPIPAFTKIALDAYAASTGISSGIVFRVAWKCTFDHNSARITPQTVFKAVRRHSAAALGIRLAPHDLRRTWAKLAHKGGAALEQIQLSLGHSSIKTTEVYIGVEQDLTEGNAPCDHLGLGAPHRSE